MWAICACVRLADVKCCMRASIYISVYITFAYLIACRFARFGALFVSATASLLLIRGSILVMVAMP